MEQVRASPLVWSEALLQNSLFVCIGVATIVIVSILWTAVVLFWKPQQTKVALLYATFDAMADGLLILDRDLRAVEWNKNYLDAVGMPPELLVVGMSAAEIFRILAKRGEFGQVDVEAEVQRRLADMQSQTASGNVEHRRPNGRVVEVRRRPMPTGGFITLYIDITERCRAEDQLRQSQKMETIGHLTGGLAHDFNNLLAVVIGNMELAAKALENANSFRAQEKIDLALDGAKRTAELTQRLLAFARRQTLAPLPIDANKVVSAMVELMRRSLPSISIGTKFGANLWQTLVDANQLESALVNLALNSRDAMPDGGKLSIETTNVYLDPTYVSAHEEVSAGQYVMVSVTDEGCGMSEEVASRAYEPFFTTKRFGEGSGLGLSQVFGFAKQSAGHLELDSKLGGGTTVRLYLPRLHDLSGIAKNHPANGSQSGTTILIAAQDDELISFVSEAMVVHGISVIAAADSNLMLQRLENHPEVSGLLVDCDMPGIGDGDVTSSLRQLHAGVAVACMVGYRSAMIMSPALRQTSHMVLHKPLSAADLDRLADRLIKRTVASV